MTDWYPGATKVPGRSAGSHAAGSGPKIVHHTTEGSSTAGAVGAYRGSGSWPHFTIEWTGSRLKVTQHLPVSVAARALAHPSGPETNRANCVQIEHVGFARSTEDWPAARFAAVADLCRWIERQTGCPAATGPGTQWGKDHPPRVSGVSFFKGSGHYGHQHVPGNDHWDPGQFDIARVLAGQDAKARAPHRTLHYGHTGPDVEALQQATRLRALRMGRPDRAPAVDGVMGERTSRDAAFVAYVLGVGTSQWSLRDGGISEQVQRWIRDPKQRNKTQKARAVARRRKHAKEQ